MAVCKKSDILFDIEKAYRESLKVSKNVISYEHDIKGEEYYRTFVKKHLRFCICMEIFDWWLEGELDHEDIISLFEQYE